MRTLTTYNEFHETLILENWLLVYFTASWCQPCSTFSPVVLQTSDTFKKILSTIKIDVESIPEAAGEFDIRSVPTVLLFNQGSVVEGVVGVQSFAQMTRWLSRKLLTF
ncbi:MAG: thioredoxin family protein [Pseudomonadota bacterium]